MAKPGERITMMNLPRERGSVQVTLTKDSVAGGRPQRATVWLDPETAQPIERAGTNEGILRVLHILHGNLMLPGFGRKVVGWVGVAMLLSSLTGLWLWWPLKGSLSKGFRWRRRPDFNSNLHHTGGFWIALPLAVLSLTGVMISFPAVFFNSTAGGAGGPSNPAKQMSQPKLGPDQVLSAAQPLVADGRASMISWPAGSPEWTVTFETKEATRQVKVKDDDASAAGQPLKAQTKAQLIRHIHDGNEMPLLWQIIIFVGGILPAVLAVTGILMWLRMRRRRARHRRNMGDLVEAKALAN